MSKGKKGTAIHHFPWYKSPKLSNGSGKLKKQNAFSTEIRGKLCNSLSQGAENAESLLGFRSNQTP